MRPSNGPKMTLVKRQQVARFIPFGQDHQRRVGDAKLEFTVPIQNLDSPRDVLGSEWLQLIPGVGHFAEQSPCVAR